MPAQARLQATRTQAATRHGDRSPGEVQGRFHSELSKLWCTVAQGVSRAHVARQLSGGSHASRQLGAYEPAASLNGGASDQKCVATTQVPVGRLRCRSISSREQAILALGNY